MIARATILTTVTVATLLQCATGGFLSLAWQHRNATPDTGSGKLLLWNATASAPRGLYLLRPAKRLHVGELVAEQPPASLANMLAARGSLPLGVPLLKYIAALAGQTICRRHDTVTIDGVAVAVARDSDHLGHPLPVWQGCRTLRAGEVFLLNRDAPDSFDGRYFGVLPVSTITARATPLWTEAGP